MAKMAPYNGKTAVNRALDWVGKSYNVGYCQKFTNEVFQTGAVGDWDGDQSADAEDGWKKGKANGKAVEASKINNLKDIPAAVMLYWTGGSNDHGHAAVGIGNGQMVSTDLPTSGKIGKVSISTAHDTWGLTFAGYLTIEGNGYDLGSYNPGGGQTPESGSGSSGGSYPKPKTKDVYLDKLKYGQKDSDSVYHLQNVLNGHKLSGGQTLPLTGNYLDQTDEEVRLCQQQHGYGNDPAKKSYVGQKQASHLFGSGYTIHQHS